MVITGVILAPALRGCNCRHQNAQFPVSSTHTPSTPFVTHPDRRQANEHAIRSAKPGDLVIIAGKGHEKYQVIGSRTLSFDDVEVAQAALVGRRGASRV